MQVAECTGLKYCMPTKDVNDIEKMNRPSRYPFITVVLSSIFILIVPLTFAQLQDITNINKY